MAKNNVLTVSRAVLPIVGTAIAALLTGCLAVTSDSEPDMGISGPPASDDAASDDGSMPEPDSGDAGDDAGDSQGDSDDGSVDEGTTGDDGDGGSDDGSDSGDSTEPGPDLRLLGPWAVGQSSDSESLPSGCSMGYDRYAPAGVDDAPAVILAHGFQGNRASMAGWAEHWASWGVQVIAPDLCHATIFDSDHAQNGADLRALALALQLGPVVYAGYSAGGLAAVLAAADDDQAIAVLGLDMVDADGLGAAASPGIAAPAFGLVGEPSQCNTDNNGVGVFQSAGGQLLRITEADHCDFQSPADLLCGLTCSGSNAQFDDASIQMAVRGLSTAVVTWQTGAEPTGEQWWTPGSFYYEQLLGLGIMQAP